MTQKIKWILGNNKGLGLVGALIGTSITLIVINATSNLFVKSIKQSKKTQNTLLGITEQQKLIQWFNTEEICTQTLTQLESGSYKYKLPMEESNAGVITSVTPVDLYNKDSSLKIKTTGSNILEDITLINGISKIQIQKARKEQTTIENPEYDLEDLKYEIFFYKGVSNSKNPFYQSQIPTVIPIVAQSEKIEINSQKYLQIIKCGYDKPAKLGSQVILFNGVDFYSMNLEKFLNGEAELRNLATATIQDSFSSNQTKQGSRIASLNRKLYWLDKQQQDRWGKISYKLKIITQFKPSFKATDIATVQLPCGNKDITSFVAHNGELLIGTHYRSPPNIYDPYVDCFIIKLNPQTGEATNVTAGSELFNPQSRDKVFHGNHLHVSSSLTSHKGNLYVFAIYGDDIIIWKYANGEWNKIINNLGISNYPYVYSINSYNAHRFPITGFSSDTDNKYYGIFSNDTFFVFDEFDLPIENAYVYTNHPQVRSEDTIKMLQTVKWLLKINQISGSGNSIVSAVVHKEEE